jgi:hypothetical protein
MPQLRYAGHGDLQDISDVYSIFGLCLGRECKGKSHQCPSDATGELAAKHVETARTAQHGVRHDGNSLYQRAHHQRAHPVKSFKSNPFPLEQTVPKEHPQTQTNVPFPHWRRSPPSSLCRQICVRQIRRLDYLGI